MKNIFLEHPNSVGETYFEHFKYAAFFSSQMLLASVACLIHAIFPFIFPHTGSNLLLKMIHRMLERMPANETRLLHLAELLEKKMHTNSPALE